MSSLTQHGFVNQYLYIFRFYTTWSIIMILFHHHLHTLINLTFVTFITMMIGLYFSFINPRIFIFYFEGCKYKYSGFEKFIIVDIIFHILAFVFILTRRYSSRLAQSSTLTACLTMFIYIMVFDTKKLYGVYLYEVIAVFMIATILYYLVFG